MADMTMGQLALKLTQGATELKADAEKRLRTVVQTGVGLMKREIQAVHAVDTGTMLNSTTADTAGKNVYYIGPTVPYAVYVALGTSRMAARPFHTTAARELDKIIQKEFSDLGGDL